MIKSINIKNNIICVIIIIFYLIKRINIKNRIIFAVIIIIFIMIKIIIFIFIIIKSLDASTPNPKLGLDASTHTPQVGLGPGWVHTHPSWGWTRPRPTLIWAGHCHTQLGVGSGRVHSQPQVEFGHFHAHTLS